MTQDGRITDAVRLLAEELRRRRERHPHGHLLGRPGDALDLALRLPLDGREGGEITAARALDEALDRALAGLLTHRAAVVPGRAFCLRCADSACGHSAPPSPRHVFARYGPSGLPVFTDFGQWLLERGDPRVERLYGNGRDVLAHVATGRELTRELLDAFRDRRGRFTLHGQVAAGWFRSPGAGGATDPFAVTMQVVSTRAGRGRRRYALNVCGTAPGDEPLDALRVRLGSIPWSQPVHWAQSVLERIEAERATRRRGRTGPVERRIEGLLGGLARRVEHGERSRGRRTRHAEERHSDGSRPTRMALTDLERAGEDQVLVDAREGTLVVVGERGRTHFFNAEGKLVTSVRYPPSAIARRRRTGRWATAPRERVDRLRESLARR